MMTVGMPVKTNPANSKVSRGVRRPAGAGVAMVVAMGQIILTETAKRGNFAFDVEGYVVRKKSDKVVRWQEKNRRA